jgi:hypothetical protein
MQDLVLSDVPLAPVASFARCLSNLAAWFKQTFVLDVLAGREHLYGWALAAARALPFNRSLNPTAYSVALMREAA